MNDKKFIVTQDELMANKMIASRFKLVSAISGVYTFINEMPEKFSFNEFDVKKLHFTNNLHL
jgi:hypothetical protein